MPFKYSLAHVSSGKEDLLLENLCRQIPFEEKRRQEKTREDKRREERRGENPTLLLIYSQINVFCDQIFNGFVNQFAIISVRKIRQLVGVIYSSSLEQVNLRIA